VRHAANSWHTVSAAVWQYHSPILSQAVKERSMIKLFLSYLLLASCVVVSGCGRNNAHVIGTLEWDRLELVAEASEPIASLSVKEGEQVKQGQVLLQLDARRLQAQLDEAQAAEAVAAARLAELQRGTRTERLADAKARWQGAENVLVLREREVQRLQDLVNKQLVSPAAVDQALAARDATRTERDRARASLDELQHGSTREEVQQAQQTLAKSAAVGRGLLVSLDRLSVRAPVDGRVDALPYKIGERPAVGNVVAVVLAGHKPYARVYVPEAMRVHVIPGTQAAVYIDGLEKSYSGVVRSVASDPAFTPYFALTEHDRGRLSYLAEIDISGDVSRLPAGIPVNVKFDLHAAGQ
jgi:HlyD family secretion protein